LKKICPAASPGRGPKRFYIWVTLPETMDASDVFSASIKKGAAFVLETLLT